MAKTARGKRDGTGPYQGSAQARSAKQGKRGGKSCPKPVKKAKKKK